MAWIELHEDLVRHRKTKVLARELGVSRVQTVGHLAILWTWALRHALDGDLSGFDPDDIAEEAGFEDGVDFVAALVKAGFVDRDGDRVLLHNWSKYVGHYRQSKEVAAEHGIAGNHERWHVKRGKVDPSCPLCVPADRGESGGDVGGNRVATPPDIGGRLRAESGSDSGGIGGNRTLPDLTGPNQTLEEQERAAAPRPVENLDQHRELADVLLDPSGSVARFRDELEERSAKWATVTDALVMRYGRQWGARAVVDAFRNAYDSHKPIDSPTGWLSSEAKRLASAVTA